MCSLEFVVIKNGKDYHQLLNAVPLFQTILMSVLCDERKLAEEIATSDLRTLIIIEAVSGITAKSTGCVYLNL